MKKTIFMTIALSVITMLTGSVSFAQNDQSIDQDIKLLRKDLRSEKKQLLAANLVLSDSEAVKFWPIYDQYTMDATKIYDARVAIVKEYAAGSGKITDAEASSISRRWIDTDTSLSKLRQKYLPIVGKVLPGRKTALFFQIDRRIGILIEVQLASEIPFIEP